MATSNDSSGSGSGSGSGGSGKGPFKPGADPRKPNALIDLKATEVEIRDPKPVAGSVAGSGTKPSQAASTVAEAAAEAAGKVASVAQPVAAASAAGAAAAKASTVRSGVPSTEASAGSAGLSSRPSAAASGAATAGEASPGPTRGPAGATSSSTSTSSGASPNSSSPVSPAGTTSLGTAPGGGAARSGGGLRGAATHLAAGLAGGLFALLGADALMPGGGSRPGTVADRTALQALERRLSTVETVAVRPADADASQAVTALDRRLGEMEKVAAQIRDQQARLAGETRQFGERLAALPGPTSGADVERIGRLEEILKTLSEASAGDTQRGRIPQLATISGKLADLEASLATQVAALRKSVTQEVDSRLGQSSEAAQSARAGTQRLDRELGSIKTETAQAAQRIEALKSQSDRVDVTVRGLRDEASQLKAEVGTVRESLSREIAQVAKPADVTSALSPLSSKLTLLEQNVQGVVRGEVDRRANVERIVMALELGNLKRTVERGAAFGNELADVRRVVGTKVDLSALERFKDKGVASTADLERDFRGLAFRIIEADAQPKDAHWTERLLASAKSVVKVRRVDQGAEEKGVEASVTRMEQALKAGKLADVASEAGTLSEQARLPAAGWLEKVNARAAVERAIAAIEQELKASLSTQTPATQTPATQTPATQTPATQTPATESPAGKKG